MAKNDSDHPHVPWPENVDGAYKVVILRYIDYIEPVLNEGAEKGWPHPEIHTASGWTVVIFRKPAVPDINPDEDSHIAFSDPVDKRPPTGYSRVINEIHQPEDS